MISDVEHPELPELLASAKAGDRPAFDELVRLSYVDTYTLALRLTANEEDARDVVQETYLRAWKGLKRFRGDSQFSTWLYRITANTAYTLTAKRKKQRAQNLDDAPEIVDETITGQPESMAESSAALSQVGAALQQLPAKLRMVVVLKDVYDMSHEDIADELGISVAAAKVRLHRGRKQLRDLLYEDGVEGSSAHAI